MSSFDSLVREAHALACIRNTEIQSSSIGIVLHAATAPSKTGDAVAAADGLEHGEYSGWAASIRLGGGKWDSRTGWGRTPSEAVQELNAKLSEAISDASERYRKLEARLAASRKAIATVESDGPGPSSGNGPPGFVVSSDGRLEPTPEQAAFMKGYTAGARSMGELTDGVAAERAYHAQVALLEGLIEQVGGASTPKEAQLLIREARQALPTPGKK